jgi:hydroxyethylthiazole kinase-like uncharacterized protein yjeF
LKPDTQALVPKIWQAIWSKEAAVQMDHKIHQSGLVADDTLMELAGYSVAQRVLPFLGLDSSIATKILVLTGPGNNGGDGLVAARYLRAASSEVSCLLVDQDLRGKKSSLNQKNLDRARVAGVPMFEDFADWKKKVAPTYNGLLVIIDAIFGLGFKGDLSEGHQKLIADLTGFAQKWVCAIDIPSGLEANGAVTSESGVLAADLTLTFGALKPVHVLAPGRHWCGLVETIDIGYPCKMEHEVLAEGPIKLRLRQFHSEQECTPGPLLHSDIHKYDRGHVLVIGGSVGMSGAPILSALSAYRGGAGWVSLALPPACKGEKSVPLDIPLVEGLFRADSTGQPKNPVLDFEALLEYVEHRSVRSIVLGPGMIEPIASPEFLSFVHDFIQSYQGTVIVDAGALRQLGDLLEAGRSFRGRLILLPHPGEWKAMFRTVDCPANLAKGADAFAEALTWASERGLSLLYKSASPIFFNEELGTADIYRLGSRFLAKAGTGDILAGLIGAKALEFSQSAVAIDCALAQLHFAALKAAAELGEDCGMASDLLARLPLGAPC